MGFRSFVAVTGLGIVLLLAACSGGVIPQDEVDFRRCESFLSLNEIKIFLGKPHLVFRAIDVTEGSKELNPAIDESCQAGFELNDHQAAIGLAAIKFDSEISATDHLETFTTQMRAREVAGDKMEFDTFAPDSYQVVPQEPGIAGIVGFRQGPYIIQLHSTAAAGRPYLMDIEQLLVLAQVIQERLP